MIKTYNPQSSHTSSSIGGWVNYMGASKEAFINTRNKIFNDFPNSVIVDGTDDWFAPIHKRPETFARNLDITPLAYYHSGGSGISKSGIVISCADFEQLSNKYQETYGCSIIDNCRIYKSSI